MESQGVGLDSSSQHDDYIQQHNSEEQHIKSGDSKPSSAGDFASDKPLKMSGDWSRAVGGNSERLVDGEIEVSPESSGTHAPYRALARNDNDLQIGTNDVSQAHPGHIDDYSDDGNNSTQLSIRSDAATRASYSAPESGSDEGSDEDVWATPWNDGNGMQGYALGNSHVDNSSHSSIRSDATTRDSLSVLGSAFGEGNDEDVWATPWNDGTGMRDYTFSVYEGSASHNDTVNTRPYTSPEKATMPAPQSGVDSNADSDNSERLGDNSCSRMDCILEFHDNFEQERQMEKRLEEQVEQQHLPGYECIDGRRHIKPTPRSILARNVPPLDSSDEYYDADFEDNSRARRLYSKRTATPPVNFNETSVSENQRSSRPPHGISPTDSGYKSSSDNAIKPVRRASASMITFVSTTEVHSDDEEGGVSLAVGPPTPEECENSYGRFCIRDINLNPIKDEIRMIAHYSSISFSGVSASPFGCNILPSFAKYFSKKIWADNTSSVSNNDESSEASSHTQHRRKNVKGIQNGAHNTEDSITMPKTPYLVPIDKSSQVDDNISWCSLEPEADRFYRLRGLGGTGVCLPA